MPKVRLTADPDDWSIVRRLTLVCLMPDGRVALTPDGRVPSDDLAPGEHPLDACLRIPLEHAGFRYQHFHPFALDGDHLYGWVEGDRYHSPPVEPTFGPPAGAADAALIGEALADHAALPPETWFRDGTRSMERAYLRGTTPEQQSGFGRGAAAWRAARLEVADAVAGSGTFLDVGCANGHLGASVAAWCGERGLRVEPYGIDLAPGLVALARRRLPQWADRFWVGNALDWVHPGGRRFDAVHTLLDCVPSGLARAMLGHALAALVAPGGRLVVSHYAAAAGTRTDEVLAGLGYAVGGWCPSHDAHRMAAGTAWITAG
ncbi:MAG TPA: class I SAM-dependent methyltransferase [Acidimicrobiales bacterium]|nr:class I SAM-dependent methyltransferase [Acidimicrobiales bacterium]